MAEAMTKADVLARIAAVKSCISDPLACPHETCAADLDAIAAAVRDWCVVEGGHVNRIWSQSETRFKDLDGCIRCGQHRAETEG